MKVYKCGEKPGKGKYICMKCGEDVHLDEDTDTLLPCQRCKFCQFRKG